jgi:uncharacterized protein (TIGR01777 family)
MATVLISGATGLVGSSLCQLLRKEGYEVRILSRSNSVNSEFPVYKWDLQKKYIDEKAFENLDYIIHLAGSPIADKKWTKEYKNEILESRVNSTKLLESYIIKTKINLKAFISASAIGIYGNNIDNTPLTEQTIIKSSSNEFLVNTTLEWEKSVDEIQNLGIRTSKVRIGIVLSTRGGALAKMLPSYKIGIGSYFGNGRQIYSWIHIDDLCSIFAYLLKDEKANGVYNAVAPNPVTNYELAVAIAKAKGQKALLLSVPEFALKLAMGEMTSIILNNANVYPDRLLTTDFVFQYPKVVSALTDLIRNKK